MVLYLLSRVRHVLAEIFEGMQTLRHSVLGEFAMFFPSFQPLPLVREGCDGGGKGVRELYVMQLGLSITHSTEVLDFPPTLTLLGCGLEQCGSLLPDHGPPVSLCRG